MTCMGMSGSGFRADGTLIMKELLLMVMLGMEIAPTMWYGVAAGTTMPWTAGQLTAVGTAPTTAAPMLASVF